ncbi:unnamed protein product, partial [Rotaria sp. Silwood1]
PKTKYFDSINGDEKYDPDENDQIYSSDGDNDAFERFNNTRGLCDQFAWNSPDRTVQSSGEANQPSDEIPLSSSVSPVLLLSPGDFYQKVNRFETAAIFGILTFEVLKVFEEILLPANEASDDGVLVKLGKRMVIVVVIGCRYYPILTSLRLRNAFGRFLAFIYVMIIIGYTVYRESFCFDFLPHSQDFSALDEVQLRIKLSTWFIIYGLISNTPHFTLLSYIGGEFGIRLLFNSRCDPQENNETEHLSTQVSGTQPLNGNPTDDRSFFQKCLDKIYQWDKEFFFSTIKIKDRLFHREIILSAIITALFYTGQLFLGMKYLKKDIKKYRTIGRYMLIEEKGIKIKEIPSKAIRYPGYLIQYTLG